VVRILQRTYAAADGSSDAAENLPERTGRVGVNAAQVGGDIGLALMTKGLTARSAAGERRALPNVNPARRLVIFAARCHISVSTYVRFHLTG
jgi:hypothetical protein